MTFNSADEVGKRPWGRRRSYHDQMQEEQRWAEEDAAAAREGAATDAGGREVADEERFEGVYSTKTFHYPHCEDLGDVPEIERLPFVSPYDAVDGGYVPCRNCHPME